MANSALIGSLRAHLGLDSAQFVQGLTKAQGGLAKFQKSAAAAGKVIGIALVAGATAAGVAVKNMIDRADDMGKMAQSIGVPVEELSRLGHAADLSGVSTEQLGKGLKRLSANLLDTAQGGVGPAAKALATLGISATTASGKIRSSSEVMSEVADRFAEMDDGALKTATSMALFGKAGADLIPMLNGGAAGIKKMTDEADELGLTISTQTAKAAEQFNDDLTRLGKVQDGIALQLTAALLPSLQQFAGAMLGAAKNSGMMQTIGAALGVALKALVSVAAAAAGAFITVGLGIKAAYEAAALFVKGDFKGGSTAFDAGIKKAEAFYKSVGQFNRDLWTGNFSAPAGEALGKTGRSFDEAAIAAGNLGKAAKKAKEEVSDLNEIMDDLTDATMDAMEAFDDEKRDVYEATRTEAEKFADELERVADLERRGVASAQQAAILRKKAFDASPQGEALATYRGKLQDLERAREEVEAATRQGILDATYEGLLGGFYAFRDGGFKGVLQYMADQWQAKMFEGAADRLTGILQGTKVGDFLGGVFTPGGGPGALPQMPSIGAAPQAPGIGGIFSKGLSALTGSKTIEKDATVVQVNPSPYFDVQVEKIAAPLIQRAMGASQRNTLNAVPGFMSSFAKLQGD